MCKQFLFGVALLICCTSCHRGNGPDAITHKRVREVGQQFYDYLLTGQYEEYVAHMADVDSMSDNMRRQLVVMMQEFAHHQQQQHGGFLSATVVSDSLSDEGYAHVFLDVLFADSTSERVGLPLRYQNGRWRLE